MGFNSGFKGLKGNINDRICTTDLKILDYPNMSICLVMNKYTC